MFRSRKFRITLVITLGMLLVVLGIALSIENIQRQDFIKRQYTVYSGSITDIDVITDVSDNDGGAFQLPASTVLVEIDNKNHFKSDKYNDILLSNYGKSQIKQSRDVKYSPKTRLRN